jgi:hypothetical protein
MGSPFCLSLFVLRLVVFRLLVLISRNCDRQEFSLIQAEAAVNLLRLELYKEMADHRLTATLRPQSHCQGHHHRERRERRRRPYHRRQRSWLGSDSRPSEDSDDDWWPPRFSYASSASVWSEATTICLGKSRAETPVDPWRWVPFDHQQAMDWGQCLEPSVQPEPRILSNEPVEGVASGMSTNEATPKQEK